MRHELKDPKLILIISLGFVFIAILIFLGLNSKDVSFEIQDKCGQFVNLVSHTIENEDTCKSRCRAQCGTKDLDFKKIDFIKKETECNYCKCFCK